MEQVRFSVNRRLARKNKEGFCCPVPSKPRELILLPGSPQGRARICLIKS